MKIYLGIKYHSDNKNKDLIEALSTHLESNGHVVICVARDLEKWGAVKFSEADLMQETFKLIEKSDLVLIELTEKGVGLGIEAGYAHAKTIPVVTIAKEGSDISATMKGISAKIVSYLNISDIKIFP